MDKEEAEEESCDYSLLASILKNVLDVRLKIYSYPVGGGEIIFPSVRLENAQRAYGTYELPIDKFFITNPDRTIHLITYAEK